MAGSLTLSSLYARIWRTYWSWARTLLPLAAVVFVPIGLLDAIPLGVDSDSLTGGSGLVATGVLVGALALVGTSLLGEVFYSGAVATTLTHDRGGEPPTLREISRHLAYGRLIAVDLIYSALVIAGLLLLLVPGVLAYVWLGLAGPVVEIERRSARAAFARSARLVRGRFWLVLAVLAPLELASEAVGGLTGLLAQALLGHTVWADWLAESLSNVIATPFVAVACVLLTVGLIAEKDGPAPPLHSAPARR
jgi:hypothetical protein